MPRLMPRLILLAMLMLLSFPALAQNSTVTEPVCEPIGRTSKGDLVYSMQCRNIPGLPAGENGYNPAPGGRQGPRRPRQRLRHANRNAIFGRRPVQILRALMVRLDRADVSTLARIRGQKKTAGIRRYLQPGPPDPGRPV